MSNESTQPRDIQRAKPRFETICKLVDALGVKLTVKAA